MSSIISKSGILIFGTLYPAYATYKAINAKDSSGYVKWLTYWVVLAAFNCIEACTDTFFDWFSLYHTLKLVIMLWIVMPISNGSRIVYWKLLRPMLMCNEKKIDEFIHRITQKVYKMGVGIMAIIVYMLFTVGSLWIPVVLAILSNISRRFDDTKITETGSSNSEEEHKVLLPLRKKDKERNNMDKKIYGKADEEIVDSPRYEESEEESEVSDF